MKVSQIKSHLRNIFVPIAITFIFNPFIAAVDSLIINYTGIFNLGRIYIVSVFSIPRHKFSD